MSNKKLFNTSMPRSVKVTNNAGGTAYAVSPKHALAQLASTGCFQDTFYVDAKTQLADVLTLASQIEPEFVAKTAIYAREKAFMKDMPALLLALVTPHKELFAKTFSRVVDNPKMLRNFVGMIRSGVTGRKSLGTRPKRIIQNCLNAWDDVKLIRGSVGASPSLGDVVKLTHPRPVDETRKALYGWLVDALTDQQWSALSSDQKTMRYHYNPANLPRILQAFEAFKSGSSEELPNVPFEMLTAQSLTQKQWVEIAKHASWTQTRMNLNTFLRHGVFSEPGMDSLLAQRLASSEAIKREKVFPYQLMVAYLNVSDGVPQVIKDALSVAMETATRNIPSIRGQIYILVDVSGSMSSPITGRSEQQSAVRCIDVAALFASSILRCNADATIIPFNSQVVDMTPLNPNLSVMENAQKLASLGGGSTNCSAPLAWLNAKQAKGDLVVYLSDYESFIDTSWSGSNTQTAVEWRRFKSRNPESKLVCIDLTPNKTVQAIGSEVLNVGGFSDQVFEVVNAFLRSGSDPDFWVKEIEKIAL